VEAPPVVRAPVKRRVVQESSRSDVEGEEDDLERDEQEDSDDAYKIL